MKQIVTSNSLYRVTRGMAFYFMPFLNEFPGFSNFIDSLDQETSVLDSGAGECIVAREWYGLQQFAPQLLPSDPDYTLISQLSRLASQQNSPHITAITYTITTQVPVHPKLKVLQNRFFNDIPNHEIGRPGSYRLILDVFGVLSYSANIDEVLSRYLGLLAQGGYIAIQMHDNIAIHTPKEGYLLFEEWLKRCGLEVKISRVGNMILLLVQNTGAISQLPRLRVAPSVSRSVQYKTAYDALNSMASGEIQKIFEEVVQEEMAQNEKIEIQEVGKDLATADSLGLSETLPEADIEKENISVEKENVSVSEIVPAKTGSDPAVKTRPKWNPTAVMSAIGCIILAIMYYQYVHADSAL